MKTTVNLNDVRKFFEKKFKGVYRVFRKWEADGKWFKLGVRIPRATDPREGNGLIDRVPGLMVGEIMIPERVQLTSTRTIYDGDGNGRRVTEINLVQCHEFIVKAMEHFVKMGYQPVFTKATSMKPVGKSTYIQVNLVPLSFANEFAKDEPAEIRGMAAVINWLNAKNLLPVGFQGIPWEKIGGCSKYLNHPFIGERAVVVVCLNAADIKTTMPKGADGQCYVAEGAYDLLWDLDALTKAGWNAEKVASLTETRVAKPVLFGTGAFGKGDVVPLNDDMWTEMFPGVPASIDGKAVIVADENFVKFGFVAGNVVETVIGLHDAPLFAPYVKSVDGTTVLRMNFTGEILEAIVSGSLGRLSDLKTRLVEEGTDFLFDRGRAHLGEEGFVLDKEKDFTRAIFNESKVSEKIEKVHQRILEGALNTPVLYASAYAVSPVGSVAEDYLNGKYNHLDVLVCGDEFNKIAKELRHALRTAKGLSAADVFCWEVIGGELRRVIKAGTLIRFPKISPFGATSIRVIEDSRIAKGGYCVDPRVWMTLMLGDYDGDTVTLYWWLEAGVVGLTPSLEMIAKVPVPKGAKKTAYAKNALEILAGQYTCQAGTGLVDTLAFGELLQHVVQPGSDIPARDITLKGCEALQSLLDGNKYSIQYPNGELSAIPGFARILRGKDWNDMVTNRKARYTNVRDFLPIVKSMVPGRRNPVVKGFKSRTSRLMAKLIHRAVAVCYGLSYNNPVVAPTGSEWKGHWFVSMMSIRNQFSTFGSTPDELKELFAAFSTRMVRDWLELPASVTDPVILAEAAATKFASELSSGKIQGGRWFNSFIAELQSATSMDFGKVSVFAPYSYKVQAQYTAKVKHTPSA